MLQVVTGLVSASVLVLYAVLACKSPLFDLLSPRGGAATLGFSLFLANVAVWVAQQSHRSLSERFQLAMAGWIWLLVQLGGTLYVLSEMT